MVYSIKKMKGAHTTNEEGLATLERLKGEPRLVTCAPEDKKLESGRTVDTAMNRIFFVCRKYLLTM